MANSGYASGMTPRNGHSWADWAPRRDIRPGCPGRHPDCPLGLARSYELPIVSERTARRLDEHPGLSVRPSKRVKPRSVRNRGTAGSA